MKITQLLMPQSQYKLKCPRITKKKKIIIHNSDNSASAMAEISYMVGNSNSVSFHAAVDENRIVEGIPRERNAWNCGDGSNGFGNNYGYAIEICRNKLTSDHEKFLQAERNAAEYTAYMIVELDLGIEDVTQHHDYNGKNCPSKTRRLGWKRFLAMVQAELDEYQVPAEIPSEEPQEPVPTPIEGPLPYEPVPDKPVSDKPVEAKPDPLNGPYVTPEREKLWFRSIAGSYRTREAAQAQVDKLKAAGYPFAWLQAVTTSTGLWFRAIAGSHDRRGPAEKEVEKLIADGYKGAWLQAVYVKVKLEEK